MLIHSLMDQKESELQAFISEHEKALISLEKEYTLSSWAAERSGSDEDFKKLETANTKMRLLYSTNEDYQKLVAIKASNEINNPLLKRQLAILINQYKANQLPKALLKAMSRKEAEITKKTNNFRGRVDGKEVTQNQIYTVLEESLDNGLRKKHWEAQKDVGPVVEKDLKELILLRNKAAKALGYANYYEMAMDLQEINIGWLLNIFDELYEMTEEPYLKAKNEIDEALRKRFNVEDIMPWHYSDPYFQSVPRVGEFDYNKIYAKNDIIPIAKKFYAGIGLNVDKVLENSDMFERKGKSQHAFCTDIDRAGDVRILMNIKNKVAEMDTLLHESGHAAYCLGHDKSGLPFLLKAHAHIFTTEAIAMMLGKLAYSGRWMQEFFGFTDREADEIEKQGLVHVKRQQLVFSRWVQVMLRFEKSMYENPEQDLNALWWKLVEKYQHVKKPEGRGMPDYASKSHICTAPVYYHNYQLGELMAAQVEDYMRENICKAINGSIEAGKYLAENIFSKGASLEWNEMIKGATGDYLNPKHFAEKYA